MKKIYLLLLLAFAFSGCEKDDICDSSTPTTPRLVIEFYDFTNPALLKDVTNLKVTGTGADQAIVFNDALPEDDENRYLANTNKIMLPLKINDDTAEYTLTLNSGNDVLNVSDMIRLNYTRTSEYVSRACGFKTLFRLNPDVNDDTAPLIINGNPAANAGNWIKNVEIIKSNLETENETHVKIFF
ncbi:hypothetical protein HYN48_10555 [Flavobacterium magnum]|uniref:Uncharacterized protein n=1 Tax=Flavobacterium magnum TaxID=2162713 RepID=A0A2S0RFF4_9FLAO|nr:DUF6452 family protein [Flavobacterium magnum]AWA30493.1 hypothetical protein HYN48_10555 [Flavobacterium magnum]